MSLPPVVVDIRVVGPGCRPVRLWLPVFILWPLLWVVGLVALVVASAVDAGFFVVGRPHRFTAFLLGLLAAAGEMRGTEVVVDSEHRNIEVQVR